MTYAYSSPSSSLVLRNVGTISKDVTAKSGSPTDIQAAVNTVDALGGGTVYIPAGNWTFNPSPNSVGVTVYANINLTGMGKGVTILRETHECAGSTMILANGQFSNGVRLYPSTQKPITIRGISFIGYVPSRADADSTTNNAGLAIHCVKDFVVYDCYFENFVNDGVSTDNNDAMSPPTTILRGVISHCDFDNPYKDDMNISYRWWGYGIVVGGNALWTDSPADFKPIYGHYDDLPNSCPMTYVEDCTFRRCRHSIAGAGSSGDYYVARHNTFVETFPPGYTSHIDQHSQVRGCEIYNNTIIGYPVDYRANIYDPIPIGKYLDNAILLRGGSALIFNNNIQDCDPGIASAPDANYFWIWNNSITYPNSGSGTDILMDSGVTYYLRAPTQSLDGFTYAPYPYPHPLVSGYQ
jgi:hypothetical protein